MSFNNNSYFLMLFKILQMYYDGRFISIEARKKCSNSPPASLVHLLCS